MSTRVCMRVTVHYFRRIRYTVITIPFYSAPFHSLIGKRYNGKCEANQDHHQLIHVNVKANRQYYLQAKPYYYRDFSKFSRVTK